MTTKEQKIRDQFEAWYTKMYQTNGMNIQSLKHKNEMLGCYQAAYKYSEAEFEQFGYIRKVNYDLRDVIEELAIKHGLVTKTLPHIAKLGADHLIHIFRKQGLGLARMYYQNKLNKMLRCNHDTE